MTRLEAVRQIRRGRCVAINHVGREMVRGELHTFRTSVGLVGDSTIKAVISCHAMGRNYSVVLTPRQLLTYLRLHFRTPHHYQDMEVTAA